MEKSMATDSWSAFMADDTKTEEEVVKHSKGKLNTLALEHEKLQENLTEITDRIAYIEGEIVHLFPEVEGVLSQSVSNHSVYVSRTEKWTWDKEMLEKFFSHCFPDYIRRTLSVDKRKFTQLPPEEQDKLRPCLTRSLNKAKVKVVKNV